MKKKPSLTKPSLKKTGLKKPSLSGFGKAKPRKIEVAGAESVKRSQLPECGELPLVIEPTRSDVDLLSWGRAHKQELERDLRKFGGILFRGFRVDSPERFQEVVETMASEALEYKERSSPRHAVAGHVYTSTDYPSDQPIFLHNENSYAHRWPGKIFFHCAIEPAAGGATPLADVRRVYDRIPDSVRQRFEEKGVLYLRNFSDLVGLPWRTVFGSDSRPEVEEYCRGAGYEFEWLDGDRLRTRRQGPAALSHPLTGERVWFNHATFFHPSTLPEAVREGLLELFPEDELPNHTAYGDGSPIEAETLEALRTAYHQETISFPWRKGDVLMLDNMLVAHGREPFEGSRQILTAMAGPVDLASLAAEAAR
ncbi:MAG: TauD/TfdA family dioxygenase [Acidobacteriota bacterium]